MNKILVCLVFGFLIADIFIFNLPQPVESINIKHEISNLDSVYQRDYILNISQLEIIEDLAYKNIIGKTWEFGVYDCTQFSVDLADSLNAVGIKAQCTAGDIDWATYPHHTWVSAWIDGHRFEIESTNGQVISDEDFKQYHIKWENFCW